MRATAHHRVVLCLAALVLLAAASPRDTRAANVSYVLPYTTVHTLHAKANGVGYSLYIRVPPDYASSHRSYPVIYMLDADYAFPVAVNISDMLGRRFEQAEETIIVGIAYTGQYPSEEKYRFNRTRDYTPAPVGDVRDAQKASGGAARFLRAIQQDVLPYVETAYRADPRDRTLVGHSYGGLFAAWVLQEHPELFHRYLMVSPSLWYNDEMTLRREQAENLPHLGNRTLVYMAIGSDENPHNGPQMVDEMNRFAKALVMRRDPNLVIEYRTFEDETHASIFPIAFSTGLRHLFGEMEGRTAQDVAIGTGH